MSLDAAVIAERFKGTLVDLMGIRFVEATPDRVVAELDYRETMTTVGGSFHGGALMALADTLGAAATVLNLPPGAGTTTIESKTNFFRAVRSGHVEALARPLHVGRTTVVVETDLFDEAGKRVARVTQTQAVLYPQS
jgi:1,4-dihydroxy-2-naphthoyl-CoA hydrolase